MMHLCSGGNTDVHQVKGATVALFRSQMEQFLKLARKFLVSLFHILVFQSLWVAG